MQKDISIEHKEVDGIWEEKGHKKYKPFSPQTMKTMEGNR
jgi:hypothetical protein